MNWNHCLRYLVASIIFLACLGSLPTTPGNMYSEAIASTKKNSDGQSADSELDRLAQEMGRHFQKKRCGVVLELGKELRKEFKNQDDTNWEKRLELYLQMAMCYWVTGNYASMDDYFEKTIEFIRQTAEKEGEAYCHCDGLKMVADLYRKLNLYDRAEKMYLESLRETEKIRGPTHKSTIALLDALVEINLKRLDYTNARQYLERSVALTAKLLGDKDQKAAQKRDKLLALESAIKQSQPATDTSTGSPQPSIFVQTGHTEDIHSVAFNANGKFAVTAGGDNLLKLWEVSSGREIRTFRGHEDTAFRALFVPGGQYMLSGSFDKTLRLWELATGREVRRFFGHHGEVLAMAVSADGKLALSGGEDKTVILWDLLSGKKIRAFYGHKKWVVQVGFFEGGNRIFSSGGKFIIWDPETGKKLAEQASTGRIYAGGARFAKYSKGNISIGEPGSGNVIQKIKIPKPAWGDPPIVNNVGTVLAYSRHKGIDILDINSGNVLYAFETQSSISNPMAFSPDGRYLLIGGKELVLYDLMNGRRQWSSRANIEGRLLRVALDSAEKRAYIKSDSDTTLKDPALAAWDLETGRRIFIRKPASDALKACLVGNPSVIGCPNGETWEYANMFRHAPDEFKAYIKKYGGTNLWDTDPETAEKMAMESDALAAAYRKAGVHVIRNETGYTPEKLINYNKWYGS